MDQIIQFKTKLNGFTAKNLFDNCRMQFVVDKIH